MASAPTPSGPSRRERVRARTLDEIKRAAREQIAAHGAAGLSLNAVGRQMGMSGPAVYRYFASRDDLLDALVADLYDDLADALAAVAAETRRRAPRSRLRALADGYRAWALAHPKEYRLMTDEASPAVDEAAARIPSASNRSMELLVEALAAVAGRPPAQGSGARDALTRSLTEWAARHGNDLPAPVMRLGLLTWTRLHGFLSLEITGVFETMGVDAPALYRSEVEGLIDEAAALFPSA